MIWTNTAFVKAVIFLVGFVNPLDINVLILLIKGLKIKRVLDFYFLFQQWVADACRSFKYHDWSLSVSHGLTSSFHERLP